MNMKSIYLILLLSIFHSLKTKSQNSFDLEFYSYSGREHNIFKAPDVLFSLDENMYFNKDSFIVNSFFGELGYDTRFRSKEKNKYSFEAGSELWTRRYLSFSRANQLQWDAYLSFTKNIGGKIILESEYSFAYKDKLGSSISGDELLRSFKYRSHEGIVGVLLDFSKMKSNPQLSYGYNNYFSDTTQMPLTHVNLGFDFENEYKLNNKNIIQLDFDLKQRNYLKYPASDSLGVTLNPQTLPGDMNTQATQLRKYRYSTIEAKYEFRPVRGVMVASGLSLFKRKDLYQGYYSYDGYSPELSLRYSRKKWYVYFYSDYRSVQYQKRLAFTYGNSADPLKYQYLDFKLKAKYQLTKYLEFYGNFLVDNRRSNTELDYKITRRPYRNYEFLFGLNYMIFD